MLHLSLTMFGYFQARIDDKPITGFDCIKTRALLAYLADEPGKPQYRSKLSELLWPERTESASLSNLRHALTFLRHLLRDSEANPPFLVVNRETITLNLSSCCEIDTYEFRKLLHTNLDGRNADSLQLEYWEKAISLYYGSFLDNFLIDDCSDFEEWIVVRREYYNALILDTLFKLAETYLDLGQYNKGETYARAQLNLAPWKEEAYQQLMKALAHQGKRSDALKQFFICQNYLSKEFGVGPSQESHRLFQLIQAGYLSKSISEITSIDSV